MPRFTFGFCFSNYFYGTKWEHYCIYLKWVQSWKWLVKGIVCHMFLFPCCNPCNPYTSHQILNSSKYLTVQASPMWKYILQCCVTGHNETLIMKHFFQAWWIIINIQYKGWFFFFFRFNTFSLYIGPALGPKLPSRGPWISQFR